ncbi:gamma-glutamyl-gamma-aminobutyrate hydrolase family protein [Paracidovorax valerianellae]|uniref:Gamma-glutamyl-gamma-aminobutyrate hydrolase PuuD (Putrescine degradation), contains GATase1-like domain n=1 Tax=Paracidovorax valerianellae TaxID=187868 RepID=A0A1G6R834_9BURK|nr:gamma-glutamyl-gamma-aminobutyrate hydrolase family protein [Paracidovorax valerianellae]MDA8445095.1 gamma-glutamyl-gamma-aminobutyrate hydrolase family protein [Paracidovorax valerianellae]SDD00255.1 Gamma-glutamyl-gamma-aminobutyrate hydrolase PuuD (putrescine degradation), contains GATase1-like domain [Paracidovorax valerianellae]
MKVSLNAAEVQHRQSESTGGETAVAASKSGPASLGPSGHPDLAAREPRSPGTEAARLRAPLTALLAPSAPGLASGSARASGLADTALLRRLLQAGVTNPAAADAGRPSLAAALAAAGHAPRLKGAELLEGSPALRGWDLSGVTFEDCRFDRTSLADTHIEGSAFQGCQFNEVSLAHAQVRDSQFIGCRFQEAMFLNATLSGVRFEASQLHSSSFEDAHLQDGSVFKGVKMPGTHFLCASVGDARIEASDLTDTVFLGTEARFRIDADSQKTARLTRPTTATLVSHEVRGITVPRVGAKIAAVAGTLPLRVEMRAASLQAAAVDAEVEAHLERLAAQPSGGKPLAQRLVIDALAQPETLPGIAQILAKAEILARHVDSVVLPGGEDISPRLYGRQAEPQTDWSGDYRRSVLELGLLHQCFHRGVPLMAICRGFQMTNVFFGAALQQHVGSQVGVRTLDDDRAAAVPAVPTAPASSAEKGVGQAEIGVFGTALHNIRAAVYHHQAVIDDQEARPDLRTALRRTIPSAAGDTAWRAVMAIESSQPRAPLIGLQFHPEFFDGSTASGDASPPSNQQLEEKAVGLRNPADLIASGILNHMSPGNDALWTILSQAATAHCHKAAITAEALQAQKAALKPVQSTAVEEAVG